ncbi:MAG: cobalamin-dependent protein [Actinomycetota bacterium]|nr:cobalamin-dependent protein [Actinomycetota bacterium]
MALPGGANGGGVVRIAGWRTTFLGPFSRPGILAQHLHDLGPDALALSCSRASALPRARRVIEAAREAGVPVLVGGRGFGADDTRARRLGADAWAATPQDALDLLAVLPPYTAPPPPVASPWLEEYAQLQLRGEQVLAALGGGELARAPVERLEHALDFLAAALFADDDDILLDYVGWLRQALPARGTRVSEVALVLERCAQALPDLPHAHALLLRAAKTAHEVD